MANNSGGGELALKHIGKKQEYKHLLLIIADQPNHEEGPGDKIQYKFYNLDEYLHILSIYVKYVYKKTKEISKFNSKNVYS